MKRRACGDGAWGPDLGLPVPQPYPVPLSTPPVRGSRSDGHGQVGQPTRAVALPTSATTCQSRSAPAAPRFTRHTPCAPRLGRTCGTRGCHAAPRAHQTALADEYLGICPLARWPIPPPVGTHPLRTGRSVCIAEERLSRTGLARDDLSF